LVPAARVALTSARDAAPRSACDWDGVCFGGALGAALAAGLEDAFEDDELLAVERDGVSPARLVEPPAAEPNPPIEPDGVNRPAP
jgi:hypothetical protein